MRYEFLTHFKKKANLSFVKKERLLLLEKPNCAAPGHPA